MSYWKGHSGQRVIDIASFKGGVGKTTTAAMTAVELAKRYPGKVLAIDLDPNNNLTDYFLRDEDPEVITKNNVQQVLSNDIGIKEAIYPTPVVKGLDVLPATPYLIRFSKEHSNNPSVLLRLKSKLKKMDYEWIVIDTPPALSLENNIALYTSDLVITPLQPSRWSLQAYDTLADQIEEVKDFSKEIGVEKSPILVAVPCMLTPKQAQELKQLEGVNFTDSFIPRNQALWNAGITGEVINPQSKAMEIIANFVDEITK